MDPPKKCYTNQTRRRRFSLRRADSDAAGIHSLGEKEVLSDEGSESKPGATARRRGSFAKMAANVARRLSNGKKNRSDSRDSQGNVAACGDSDTAAAIDKVKEWDEQEEKGSVAPNQPPIQASRRRRGSITNRASEALRRMTQEKSRRPTTERNLTTSGIFKSLMAGELGTEDSTSEQKQSSRSSRGKSRRATVTSGGQPMRDAADMPISAASTTKPSRRGRRITVSDLSAREHCEQPPIAYEPLQRKASRSCRASMPNLAEDEECVPFRTAEPTGKQPPASKRKIRGRRTTVADAGRPDASEIKGVRRVELSSSVLFRRGLTNLMSEKKRASCPNL